MDSINVAKGYGKVSSLEDQSSASVRPSGSASRKRLIGIVIASIVILSAVIAVAVGVLIHESNTEGPEEEESPKSSSPPVSSNSSSSSLSESIRTVCSYTDFPDSCFTGVSNSNSNSMSNSKSNLSITLLTKFDPEIVYSLSLQAAIEQLVNLTSFPNTLILKYKNESKTVSALNDCVELFADGLSQLNNSADSINGGGSAVAMTEKEIEDVKTWTSAAMTDLETCLDGLEEMESTALDEVRTRVQGSKEYISNSLAILSNMPTILDRFHLKLH